MSLYIGWVNHDNVIKSPDRCHCEERSDVAILVFQLLTKAEIASLRSQ